jgi:hypothetical protein
MREVEDYSGGYPPRKIWVNLTAVKMIEPTWISDSQMVSVAMYSLYLGGNRYVIVTKEEGESIVIDMLEILMKLLDKQVST